jgi:hypothetical protein
MRWVTIGLPDALYAELEVASAGVHELGYSPAACAQEAIESALATRRLPSVSVGRCGPRVRAADIDEAEAMEPETYYRVQWPEPESH